MKGLEQHKATNNYVHSEIIIVAKQNELRNVLVFLTFIENVSTNKEL